MSAGRERGGRESWDLFCRVVDNFGDVGIAWRLACQLAADASRSIRLYVDGLDSLARIEPRVDAQRDRQSLDEIDIVRWPSPISETLSIEVATIVVELLGCGLPPAYVDAMAVHMRSDPLTRLVWIDFEHLSAERWVADFHRRPSPHPHLPLVKHFFYPGFEADTGGLLLEPGLMGQDGSTIDDAAVREALWRRLSVEAPRNGEKRLSLFAYPDAPVDALLRVLAEDRSSRWSVLVPMGVATEAIASFFDGDAGAIGRARERGSLTVSTIPFVDQADYDRLLHVCDINFVRGEDSFVRAQAAGKPFVWQIYRQAEGAHEEKLVAFELLYEATLDPGNAAINRAFWHAWNAASGSVFVDAVEDAARAWLKILPVFRAHALVWKGHIEAMPPLIERLTAFVATSPSPDADGR
jgi:uncharacterized repeat protein (TIGR03837 family)